MTRSKCDTRQHEPMPVSVRTGACLADAGLRETVVNCVYWTLRRYAKRICDVGVWLDDVNGPRGGIDRVCRIQVRLAGPGILTVESRAGTIHAAVGMAADRAKRAIVRKLKRRRMVTRFARGFRKDTRGAT